MQHEPKFYDLNNASEKEIRNYYKNNPLNQNADLNTTNILDTTMLVGDGLKKKWITKKFF